MNLHLRCVCESERCHCERLRTSILSMTATLSPSVIVQPHQSNDGQESRKRKVRSDKGKA